MLVINTKAAKKLLKHKFSGVVLLLPLFVLVTTIGIYNASASAAPVVGFNPGKIIDDVIFTNSNSMTANQIQSFLNSKVPVCDTWGTQQSELGGGTRAQWGDAHGSPAPFVCLKDYTEGGKSSAQIIFDAANEFTINPQVLIVLLQKEQGLVTDTWPVNSQYRSATGYGCPDTAACDSQYYGLTNQIRWAARMFRAIMNNSPNWYTPYVLGNNFIRWNPASSCGGTNVTIQNRSTQALYNYTPYQPNQSALNAGYGMGDSCGAYGNRNFYLYFTDWFGSTQFPQPAGGSLYSQTSTGKIFLINDSVRFYIPDWDTMVNFGLDAYAAQPVTDTVIQNITDGGTLTNLIWDGSGVYLVNNRSIHHVSGDVCTAWGFSCLDGQKVKSLGSAFQNQYLRAGGSLGSLAYINNTAYQMSGGLKRPIANSQTMIDLQINPNSGLVASSLNAKQTLGQLLITTPGIMQFTPNNQNYYYDGSTYYKLNDPGASSDWALARSPQIVPPLSSYNQTPPTGIPLGKFIIHDNIRYVIDQGRKILIPSSLTSLWQNTQFTDAPMALLGKLSDETLGNLVWADPYIYYLHNGKKHYVATYDDFIEIKKTNGEPTNIKIDKLFNTPQGVDAIVDGQIISDGSGRIYVTNNRKLTYIPNAGVFDAYGFNWSSIREYNSSILTEYPLDNSTLGYGLSANGFYYIGENSQLHQLSPSQAIDFGIINDRFKPVSNQVLKRSATTLSRFLYNTDTGRIYYASGGAIHYVASYSAFVAYGGNRTPSHVINNDLKSLFTEAQPVF